MNIKRLDLLCWVRPRADICCITRGWTLICPHYIRIIGRPDLSSVLTKIHVFRLTQYSKVIFLDADVLPVRPLSHLFTLPHEFSAVPDVGWPDIFNSGMMVLTPGEDKFQQIRELVKIRGSWDGGDQGILNEWRGEDWHRLSFTYNTTPTAAYTYVLFLHRLLNCKTNDLLYF